jgi:phosphoribosyl 1,2-cyclic phosphodiesterase
MALTVSVLGSGSRGNTTLIKTSTTRILIDAGLSRKEISKRLLEIGEDPNGIDAVLITHEHNDHAAGLKTLVKDLQIQAFLSPGTMREIRAEEFELNGSTLTPVSAGVCFRVGDAEITPFAVPHDAAEPVAFSIRSEGIRVTQLTDIGHLTESVADHLKDSNVLILESNHDIEMLRVGPYPWSLKQRLMGRFGHLSNTGVAQFIREQFDGMASHLLLAHLSERNNHPAVARQESVKALRDRGYKTAVTLTSQWYPTAPIQIS